MVIATSFTSTARALSSVPTSGVLFLPAATCTSSKSTSGCSRGLSSPWHSSVFPRQASTNGCPGCKHYGRYVDDFYVVSADIDFLHTIRQSMTLFLHQHLNLEINTDKTIISEVRKGVQFLGAYLKPHRRYVAGSSLRRMKSKVVRLNLYDSPTLLRATINSYLGLLSHYRSYHIRQVLFFSLPDVHRFGYYVKGMKKYVLNANCCCK